MAKFLAKDSDYAAEEGVAKLKPPVEGQQVDYFDTGMPGLVLRVNYGGVKYGARCTTFPEWPRPARKRASGSACRPHTSSVSIRS